MKTIVPNWNVPPHIQAFTTTREGGVSLPPFDSFNLGDHVEDDKSAVKNQRVLVERYRAEGKPSLPTTIGLEKQINPFLQAKNLDEFTKWRLAKDKF